MKINLRNQRIDIFDHQTGPRQQLQYFKELYVDQNHSERSKWEKYSNKLRKLGFNDKITIGPIKQEFLEMIEQKGLTVNLNKKRNTEAKAFR